MTAIAIWLNDERPAHPALWVAADSRVTAHSGVLDDGAKIFGLPVVCRAADKEGFFSEVTYAHSFGFCCAGSTLMGQNSYLALVPLLSNLAAAPGYVPSLESIAAYVHRYLVRTFDDFKVTAGPGAMFEAAVFGYCHRSSRARAFHFLPNHDADTYALSCVEWQVSSGHALYLGDEKGKMESRLAAAFEGESVPGRPLSRIPRYVIQDSILDDSSPTVGGDIQLGIADSLGFRAYALCKPRVEGQPEAFISYLGRELTPELMQVGDAFVAGPVIV